MVNRPGLYFMVLAGIATTCTAKDQLIEEMRKDRLDRDLAQVISDGKLQRHEKNVLGDSIPEIFYQIDSSRLYLEIDGKPVEDYFSERLNPRKSLRGGIR